MRFFATTREECNEYRNPAYNKAEEDEEAVGPPVNEREGEEGYTDKQCNVFSLVLGHCFDGITLCANARD